jgi:hypothetical protein
MRTCQGPQGPTRALKSLQESIRAHEKHARAHKGLPGPIQAYLFTGALHAWPELRGEANDTHYQACTTTHRSLNPLHFPPPVLYFRLAPQYISNCMILTQNTVRKRADLRDIYWGAKLFPIFSLTSLFLILITNHYNFKSKIRQGGV